MKFKIIIPVLNEERELSKRHLSLFLDRWGKNTIFVDSGSEDNTLSLLKESGVNFITLKNNRSITRAIKKCCEEISEDYILILPVDCFITDQALVDLEKILTHQDVYWGAFYKKYTQSSLLINIYLFLQNQIRTQIFKNLVWTNVIFSKKQLFLNVAKEEGFLEDVILCDTLKKYSRPLILKGPVISSFRRYNSHFLKRVYINLKIMFFYRLKLRSIDKLKSLYLK